MFLYASVHFIKCYYLLYLKKNLDLGIIILSEISRWQQLQDKH